MKGRPVKDYIKIRIEHARGAVESKQYEYDPTTASVNQTYEEMLEWALYDTLRGLEYHFSGFRKILASLLKSEIETHDDCSDLELQLHKACEAFIEERKRAKAAELQRLSPLTNQQAK